MKFYQMKNTQYQKEKSTNETDNLKDGRKYLPATHLTVLISTIHEELKTKP